MNKINKKAFTLIELIVVIAVIGILILLGSPRLLGYTEKAQLTRIQHDVKVMEQEMGEVLSTNNQELNNFQNNGKDLGRVILRKELFEKEGVAKNVNWEHLSINSYANSNSDNEDNELGMGGDLIEVEVDDKYSTYKIIPKEYSRKVNTKLKGTFYVNSLGKVYYEHNKPLGEAIEKEILACVAPESLGYEFEIVNELGTITGWAGDATHLVIPASFKMSDGGEEWCEPVRVISKGAFQNGTFKKVTIPQSVETIEDEAFQGGQLIEIEVPHSVTTVGDNAFSGNPATSSGGSGGSRVIIKGSSDGRNISDSAFGGSDYTYSPVTDKDLGVITKDNGGKTVSIVGKTATSDSSSSNSRDYSNTVISIPKELEINGEILPVTEIEKGAFQGSGLIDVIMPEGLLYIHDYAFAGNQLVRAVIPNSVIEVGNYAFAYNEIESKPTIDPIDILESKFTGNFGYVNSEGNISQPVSAIDLKSHIFIISSMGNHVIEDVGTNPEQAENNNDEEEDNNEEGLMTPIEPREPVTGEIAIASADKLAKIGQIGYPLDGDYILTANIDLSHIGNWEPIGNNNSRFTGSFNGNGYKITELTINRSTNHVGLFGYTEGATISNVALEEVNVTGWSEVGGLVGYALASIISNSYATGTVEGTSHHVGGLVGYANSSIVENSYATGSVESTGSYVGGLVGASGASTISNSYAAGSVTGGSSVGGLAGYAGGSTIENSYATGLVTGSGKYVGGLVGWAYTSTISNSYSTGTVTGGSSVGGLAGQAGTSSVISNSYATGSVTGLSYTGGLVGEVIYSSTIINSYWDTQTTRKSLSAGSNNSFGKTTVQMKKKSTYSGWSFGTIWDIDEGQSYPYLISNPQ